MSGDHQRDDDDFLDDFIIEDVGAKNDDLESLFEHPDAPKASGSSDAPDAEDLLFTDHSREPTFEGRPQFAEDAPGAWDGKDLDLEAEAGAESTDPAMADAEQSFTRELDSLLKNEDDFGPDSEQDLEVIGGSGDTAGDGISEFEQSGPFVLDDGDGAWQEESAAAEASESTDEESVELGLGAPLQSALGDAEVVEPGWEPLPGPDVDQLAEVGEVARAEDGADGYAPADEFAPQGGEYEPALAAAEAEGHDIYAQEEEVAEVVGTREIERRGLRVWLSLAASAAILAGAAVVVTKPEWVGLGNAPEKMPQVEVGRPNVVVAVPVPEVIAEPLDGEPTPDKPTVVTTPPVVEPPPVVVEPSPPSPPTNTTPPVEPAPVQTTPPDTVPTPSNPVVLPAPPVDQKGWPVREAPPVGNAGAPDKPNLIRVNEQLLIGEPDPVAAQRPKAATEGVMPGSRAFAQLANGNYFIGSVKTVDSERLTLNVDNGEVTLQVAALARLTELGSADYSELQRVTSGFVRLTNNNRLVGGILSGIADDHVVLEFRSNRVMLPRSVVGQVVQGEGDAGVRLDTTREEDDWLRKLVERQVGSGAPPAPAPAPGAAPPGGRTQR